MCYKYSALLDYDGFICKAFYASKKGSKLDLVNAQEILDRLTEAAERKTKEFFKTEDIEVLKFITRHSGKKDLVKSYKAQREKDPLLSEFRELNISRDDVFGKAGYEADDFIINETLRNPTHTLVFSDDKDIKYYTPNYCKINLEEQPVCQDLEEMQHLAAAQLLAGDREDNIKGIPGVGMKKALKLLGDDYSMENVIKHYKDKLSFEETLDNLFLLLPLDVELTPEENYKQTRADLYDIWLRLENKYTEE